MRKTRTMPLLACPDCDALLAERDIAEGQIARCPRCHAVLFHHRKHAMPRTLAFSLAGLILYLPANLLPIMTFEVVGNHTYNAMFRGVLMLWEQGYWWMAFLVFLCSMVVPLLELLMLFFIALSVRLGYCSALLVYLTRKSVLISRWGMLDVYLLGILIAMIKMGDLGEILMGPALWAYVALMLCSIASAVVFDVHEVWQFIERSRAGRLQR